MMMMLFDQGGAMAAMLGAATSTLALSFSGPGI